jgi:hypothetical protein
LQGTAERADHGERRERERHGHRSRGTGVHQRDERRRRREREHREPATGEEPEPERGSRGVRPVRCTGDPQRDPGLQADRRHGTDDEHRHQRAQLAERPRHQQPRRDDREQVA